MAKKTYGVSLNTKNPADAGLYAQLEASRNASETIRSALLHQFERPAGEVASEQEIGSLRAELAWLKQNYRPAPVSSGGLERFIECFEALLGLLAQQVIEAEQDPGPEWFAQRAAELSKVATLEAPEEIHDYAA